MKNTIDLIKTMYQTRDLNKIEAAYQALFTNQSRPILIGTSNAELYFNKESIAKLFKSDLESWGNVYIDDESMTTHSYGPYKVIHIPSKIRQNFVVTDETYQDFSNYIKEIRNSMDGSLYQKLMLIQLMLAHLLSDRPQEIRCYDWDLSLDLIIDKNHTFVLMFSMPINDLIPDVRLDDFSDQNKKIYNHELKLIEPFASKSQDNHLVDLIKNQIKDLKKASNVFLDSNQLIIDQNENYISFVGIGYYTKRVTLEERLQILISDFYDHESPKRSLFNLRRDISQHLLHDALGEEMEIQFRMIGIASKRVDQLKIEYINISLPFNLILEEKTNDLLIMNNQINS